MVSSSFASFTPAFIPASLVHASAPDRLTVGALMLSILYSHNHRVFYFMSTQGKAASFTRPFRCCRPTKVKTHKGIPATPNARSSPQNSHFCNTVLNSVCSAHNPCQPFFSNGAIESTYFFTVLKLKFCHYHAGEEACEVLFNLLSNF